MSVIRSNNERASRVFKRIVDESSVERGSFALVVVQHVVPNSVPLFSALKDLGFLAGIIPKEKSTNLYTLNSLMDQGFTIIHSSRSKLCDENYLKKEIKSKIGDRKLVILDIGGYFANSLTALADVFGSQMIGIVEDTENGHQKYERSLEELRIDRKFPIYSVARSPLKEPEDFLVGQSVLYSAENLLRSHSALLTNKNVLVIGYGKIGKSIANSLAVRNVTVWVHDEDPIKCAQALAHGFSIPERETGIANADLIIGATGNRSLVEEDFYNLKHLCFVCSVTSADDEFDFGNLRDVLNVQSTMRDGEIFHIDEGRYFYLLNEGNAVNFLHGAVLGPYIYLVACELIACAIKLVKDEGQCELEGIAEICSAERRNLALTWLSEFNDEI